MQGIASNPITSITNENLTEKANFNQYPLIKAHLVLGSTWSTIQPMYCAMYCEKKQGCIQFLNFSLEKYKITIGFGKDPLSKSNLLKYLQTSTDYPFVEASDAYLSMEAKDNPNLFFSAMDFLLDSNELDECCNTWVSILKKQIDNADLQLR
jgi:hypothetical protein